MIWLVERKGGKCSLGHPYHTPLDWLLRLLIPCCSSQLLLSKPICKQIPWPFFSIWIISVDDGGYTVVEEEKNLNLIQNWNCMMHWNIFALSSSTHSSLASLMHVCMFEGGKYLIYNLLRLLCENGISKYTFWNRRVPSVGRSVFSPLYLSVCVSRICYL